MTTIELSIAIYLAGVVICLIVAGYLAERERGLMSEWIFVVRVVHSWLWPMMVLLFLGGLAGALVKYIERRVTDG